MQFSTSGCPGRFCLIGDGGGSAGGCLFLVPLVCCCCCVVVAVVGDTWVRLNTRMWDLKYSCACLLFSSMPRWYTRGVPQELTRM